MDGNLYQKLIHMTQKEFRAFNLAYTVLRFNDSSDYESALYGIIETLTDGQGFEMDNSECTFEELDEIQKMYYSRGLSK